MFAIVTLQGQFVGVVGKVGSGKSSLLSAITAEMRKTYGEVCITMLLSSYNMSPTHPLLFWGKNATLFRILVIYIGL